jgi:hypothetical protein
MTYKEIMKYVDKDIIRERKRIYGSNFEDIAKIWTFRLSKKLGVFDGFKLTEQDVAMMMADMKKVRKRQIEERLKVATNEKEIQELKLALEDTLKDMANYLYIAFYYHEYKEL